MKRSKPLAYIAGILCLARVASHSEKKPIEIQFLFKTFEPEQNDIDYFYDRENVLKEIDGKRPYGSTYDAPESTIASNTPRIGNKTFTVPQAAFEDLFNTNRCTTSGFSQSLQAFTSMNREYVYLYFAGGQASDTYFGKLVSSQKEYLTQCITGYGPLHLHNAFHDGFIGF